MGNWEAKIYINKEHKNTIKMTKLNPSLREIRKSCGDIFPNNDECYYFISKDKNIIKSEENFSVSDVCEELKNEKGKKE